jgi:polysaccharide pyruvyl transferase WcaK-like protein
MAIDGHLSCIVQTGGVSRFVMCNGRVCVVVKTVSLVYAYGLKNAGDIAITFGAIEVLLKIGFNIKAFSMYSENDREFIKTKQILKGYYPQVQLFGSPFQFNRDHGLFRNLPGYISGFLTALNFKSPHTFLQEFAGSKIVVFNGGNLFRCESFTDFARLLALMYPLRVACKIRMPFLIFPQSASNINRLGKLVLKRPLRDATAIWSREDMSLSYLNKLFPGGTMFHGIDLAFFISQRNTDKCINKYRFLAQEKLDPTSRTHRIGFTIRAQRVGDLGRLGSIEYKKIRDCMSQTICDLLEAQQEILLVVQAKKDREIITDIYNDFSGNDKIRLIEEYDPIILKEIYSKCDILVGMRLHSIILALSVQTPAVGLFNRSWGLKNPGLMEKFGLPFKYVDDDVQTLMEEIESVLSNHGFYRKQIQEIVNGEKKNLLDQIRGVLQTLDLK